MPDQAIWKSHDKALLRTSIQIDLTEVKIITGHCVPFHRFGEDFLNPRFQSIRIDIEEFILKNPETCSVFAGDLNYEDIDKLLPKLSQAGFQQVLPPGPTESHSQRRHDHILASSRCKTLNARIIDGHGDHCLCVAEIEVPQET